MAGMDAVVLACCRKERRRIAVAWCCHVIRRVGLQERPILGLIGIAILGNPAGAGQQLRIAARVDRWDGAEQRAKAVRVTRQHVGNKNPAVGTASAAIWLGPGDTAPHKVRRHRREVVVRQPPAGAAADLMPARAKLAASSDLHHHA